MRLWPIHYIGDRLLLSEDLEYLSKTDAALTREMEKAMAGRLTGPFTVKEAITAARILYARLLSGTIRPDDRGASMRVLERLIEAEGWPGWESDMKLIYVAICGSGLMPGCPLAEDLEQSLEQAL